MPSSALLCRDVVIARAGEQLYHSSELPMANADSDDDDGILHVQRDAAGFLAEVSRHWSFAWRCAVAGGPALSAGRRAERSNQQLAETHTWRPISESVGTRRLSYRRHALIVAETSY